VVFEREPQLGAGLYCVWTGWLTLRSVHPGGRHTDVGAAFNGIKEERFSHRATAAVASTHKKDVFCRKVAHHDKSGTRTVFGWWVQVNAAHRHGSQEDAPRAASLGIFQARLIFGADRWIF
jgi:hypothetical protein